MAVRRGGVFGDAELGSLGAPSSWAGPTPEVGAEIRQVQISCDEPGCSEKLFCGGLAVADDFARLMGWLVLGTGKTFCVKHFNPNLAESLESSASELDLAEEAAGVREAPVPVPPAPPAPRAPMFSAAAVVCIGLLTGALMAVGLIAQRFYLRANAAEAQVTEHQLGMFEERAQIYRIDCDGYLTPHRTCSGRMGTAGQAQVKPVRYHCDKDGCALECGAK